MGYFVLLTLHDTVFICGLAERNYIHRVAYLKVQLDSAHKTATSFHTRSVLDKKLTVS